MTSTAAVASGVTTFFKFFQSLPLYLVQHPNAKPYNTDENWSKITKEFCNHNTRAQAVHCNTCSFHLPGLHDFPRYFVCPNLFVTVGETSYGIRGGGGGVVKRIKKF
jgi:hypothetical protein